MTTEQSHLMSPIRRGPIRFAVGHPDGLTSNSWRVWTSPAGDVYISCRDNFKEAKVSLHASGRWRMGFTEKAVEKNARLLTPDGRRTWDVWDRPPPSPPGVVTAFHLVFLSSELGVPPEQRSPKDWGEVIYIEPAPAGQMLLLTLFVTTNEPILKPKGDVPSVCLASLGIGSDRFARLVAYGAPEDDIPEIIARWASQVRTKAHSAGMALPPGAFGYLLGRRDDGVRYIVSARVFSN